MSHVPHTASASRAGAGARSLLASAPAPVIFVIGGTSMYLGAALAVQLFAYAQPASVAWMRMFGAALVLLGWRRPWSQRAGGRRPVGQPLGYRRIALAGTFGVVTLLMNVSFYEAIDELPLGTAVAVEFVGPVTVAAIGSRGARDWLALGLAAAGVGLIADVRLAGSPMGVAFALLAAVFWAGYILLGKRVAGGGGADDLAVGFAVASVVLLPLALDTAALWSNAWLLLLGLAAGVLSTVVPYALDQVVLRRVGSARFALLLALLPATATVIGLVALLQLPGAAELAGIAAVMLAVLLGATGRQRAAPPAHG